MNSIYDESTNTIYDESTNTIYNESTNTISTPLLREGGVPKGRGGRYSRKLITEGLPTTSPYGDSSFQKEENGDSIGNYNRDSISNYNRDSIGNYKRDSIGNYNRDSISNYKRETIGNYNGIKTLNMISNFM